MYFCSIFAEGPHKQSPLNCNRIFNSFTVLRFLFSKNYRVKRPLCFILGPVYMEANMKPANHATRLEGLKDSSPLHATHLTGTVSGLRELSLERWLSTTSIMADQ